MAATVMRVRQIKDVEAAGLGERIKQARLKLAHDKSLEKICGEVGISKTYWYEIEKEAITGTLSVENLRKIEAVLDVDLGVKL